MVGHSAPDVDWQDVDTGVVREATSCPQWGLFQNHDIWIWFYQGLEEEAEGSRIVFSKPQAVRMVNSASPFAALPRAECLPLPPVSQLCGAACPESLL